MVYPVRNRIKRSSDDPVKNKGKENPHTELNEVSSQNISNRVYIYEDELFKNFLPLVYLRPVFDLYCGRLTLFEKIQNLYPNQSFGFLVRPVIAQITKEKYLNANVNDSIKSDKISLFLSGRVILEQAIEVTGKEEIFISEDNDIVGFRVKNSRIKQFPINTKKEKRLTAEISEKSERKFSVNSASSAVIPVVSKTVLNWKLPKKQVKAISVKYLWDLIELNHQELINDFPKDIRLILKKHMEYSADSATSAVNPLIHGKFSPHAIIIGDISNLYLGLDAEIEAYSIIDLRAGPVYIDTNAKVMTFSKIIGPAYIGKNTIIDQAKISGGTTIGENCRVSGEVEASIFQGFVNKHHYGFIGHSYIGEWVNLGAGTTNSDLKNNYSFVKVKLGNKKIDTGQIKVGCFIGDHSKTAIGTMIPTGAVIGVFANVFEPSANLKSMPNFYWSKGKRWQLEKAIATAKLMMSHRNVALSVTRENLIRKIFKAL